MKLFHTINDAQIILYSKGVFKQVSLFHRGEDLFAKHGSGFIRVMRKGDTSAPSVSWIDMSDHDEIKCDGGRFNAPRWKGKE